MDGWTGLDGGAPIHRQTQIQTQTHAYTHAIARTHTHTNTQTFSVCIFSCGVVNFIALYANKSSNQIDYKKIIVSFNTVPAGPSI